MADGGPRRGSIKDAPYVAPFSWTGFYVGVNAGYAWGDSDTATGVPVDNFTGNAAASAQYAATASPSFDLKRFNGGVQAGYNVQSGSLVWGLEADINSMRLNKSAVTTTTPAGFAPLTSTTTVDTDWMATMRARLGFAMDRTLIYVTGGLALTDFSYAQTNVYTGCCTEAASASKTKTGWVIGAGFEHALDRKWSFKAEYLYADFNSLSTSANFSPVIPGIAPHTHSADLTVQTVRVGVNYKF